MENDAMNNLTVVGWDRNRDDRDALVDREWLVTNGLGGYASGTIAGVAPRRHHGLLVADLPNPWGRTMMFDHLIEEVHLPDNSTHRLGSEERHGDTRGRGEDTLEQF